MLILLLLLVLLMYIGIAYGSVDHTSPEIRAFILFQIRFPRVILGLIVGMALAIAGTVMQGVLHNHLADPYLLGIAGGATAGAAFAIHTTGGGITVPVGALLGGGMAVLLVYHIAQKHRGALDNTTLILAGIAIGTLFSAITSLMLLITTPHELRQILFWTMGSLTSARWNIIFWLLIVVLICMFFSILWARDLNALSLGEETAWHLGISPERTKKIFLALATILTASVVCVAGTIGFVGLIIPHIMRLLIGPDHRWLIPTSALAGAILLIGCDTLARTIVPPQELPIGMITALLGVPFFLYLLRKQQKR